MNVKEGRVGVGVIVGLILAILAAALYIMFEIYIWFGPRVVAGIGLTALGVTVLFIGRIVMHQLQHLKQGRGVTRPFLICAILLLLFTAWFVWPWIYTYPQQDDCTFGPVSNARYRELLAEVKRRQEEVWPEFKIAALTPKVDSMDRSELFRDELAARFKDMGGNTATIYEQIALLHAIMRGLKGHHYMNSIGDDWDVEAPFESRGPAVLVRYEIDGRRYGLSGMGWFFHWVNVSFMYQMKDTPNEYWIEKDRRRGKAGDFFIHVSIPSSPDNIFLPLWHSYVRSHCPAVPSEEWAEAWDHKHRSVK